MRSFGYGQVVIIVWILNLCQKTSGQMRGNYGAPYQGHGNYHTGGYVPQYPSMGGNYQANRGGYVPYNSMPYQGGNYGPYNSMGGQPSYNYRGTHYGGNGLTGRSMGGNQMGNQNPYVSTNDRKTITSVQTTDTNDYQGHGAPRLTSADSFSRPQDDFDFSTYIKKTVAYDVAHALAGTRDGSGTTNVANNVGAAAAAEAGVKHGVDQSIKETIGRELASTLKDTGVGGSVAEAIG